MAIKSIAWNDGSGDYIRLTYNGNGNEIMRVESDANNLAVARSKVITLNTTKGGVVTKNLPIYQEACSFPIGDIRNFNYTGTKQTVELPAGQYKLQCWGAQGGSNGTNSSYGITAKAGGKGGYSEGTLTLTQTTIVEVNVGGQGSASAGGFNGGGSTTGTSQYNIGNEFGFSKMGSGGGASDIRLTDGSLYSRFIVAGGGSGGAMCYQSKTTSTTSWTYYNSGSNTAAFIGGSGSQTYACLGAGRYNVTGGKTYRAKLSLSSMTNIRQLTYILRNASDAVVTQGTLSNNSYKTITCGSSVTTISFYADGNYGTTLNDIVSSFTWTMDVQTTSSSTTTSTDYQVGGVGGGTQGGAYSSTYAGKQNAAGSGGSFGQGAAQSVTNYRYCSGAGGGGWYGGGSSYSDNSMTSCKYSGGGSGFVNTAANASYRPSGYTGLELDSGITKDGSQSFEAPGGGTETGHSGNGYIRITRIG